VNWFIHVFSGPVIFEYNYGGRTLPYLPECLDFKEWQGLHKRTAGFGCDTRPERQVKLISSVTEVGRRQFYGAQTVRSNTGTSRSGQL